MGRLGIEGHGSCTRSARRWVRPRAGCRGSAARCSASARPRRPPKIELRATGLAPGFRAAIRDYTVPCVERTRLVVRAPGTADARIGRGEWFERSRERTVQLIEGQAIKVAKRSRGRSRHLLDSLSAGGLPELRASAGGTSRATTTTSSIRSGSGAGAVRDHRRPLGRPGLVAPRTGAIDAKVIDRSVVWATDFEGLAFNTRSRRRVRVSSPERPAGAAGCRRSARRPTSTTCSRPRTATTCCSPTGFAPASTPALTTGTRTQPSTTASSRRCRPTDSCSGSGRLQDHIGLARDGPLVGDPRRALRHRPHQRGRAAA